MAIYSAPGFVDYAGVPALQPNSVDFSIETDNKDVHTLLLGRAGHSAGSKSVKASVNSAIPQAGMEIDWVGIGNAQAEISLGFHLAGKVYNCRGDVRSVKLGTSVDKANEVSFEFSGRIVNIV
jgi:hypothetical protein